LQPRTAATARLTGTYAAITEAQSVAALRPIFLQQAQQLGLEDLDAAALKDARPRSLTQHVATYIYETTKLDGVRFLSRHGDDTSCGPSSNAPKIPTSALTYTTRPL